MRKEIQGDLLTTETLLADLRALGLTEGMTVIVHSSMKSLGGWVAGGSVAVILALEAAIGQQGTLVMPTHTGDLSDPEQWVNPPIRKSWWKPVRNTMPAYDPDLTPTDLGSIPECFRKQRGVKRSSHPQVSFAAWGSHRDVIIDNHSLEYGLGEQSPLARIYDLNGWVLLLGVGNRNNTSMHLAEYRSFYAKAHTRTLSAPIYVDGERRWVAFRDLDFDSSDFETIGNDFIRSSRLIRRGKVGKATAWLIPQRNLIDYAVDWMNENRNRSD